MVDVNYTALFNHGIKMLLTYQPYILDPRFVPRLQSRSGAIFEKNSRFVILLQRMMIISIFTGDNLAYFCTIRGTIGLDKGIL